MQTKATQIWADAAILHNGCFNAGPSAIAYIIKRRWLRVEGFQQITTTNIHRAELEAIICAIRTIQRHPELQNNHYIVFCDDSTIIEKLYGIRKPRSFGEAITQIHTSANAIPGKWIFQWIPRTHNNEAHCLARAALFFRNPLGPALELKCGRYSSLANIPSRSKKNNPLEYVRPLLTLRELFDVTE